jgi:hypothetical protein
MEMHPVYLALDPYLIWFYRLTGQAALDFFLGTFVLAWLALLVGEFTSKLAASLVKRQVGRVGEEAKKYQDLSLEALKLGDRPAYEAANKLANEAFGKSFFMQLTLSATFFWPIFFVLGWMQYRFLRLAFPLPVIGFSLGYIGIFILIYVLAYVLYKQIKRRLPLFRGAAGTSDQTGAMEGLPPAKDPAQNNVYTKM